MCGMVTTVAGFFGLIYPILSVFLILPIISLVLCTVKIFQYAKTEKVLISILVVIWLLHATGLFVPETGFDALWYHLPIVQQFVLHHRIFYIPELYQSLNPLFSDIIFLLGFQVAREFGAKIIAFLFAIGLVLTSYQLSRKVLSRKWSLVITVLISSFQVVAWQSTSFYVDVAKAMWEVAAVWTFLFAAQKSQWKWILTSALFLGASLATKDFSFLLIPAFVIGIFLMGKKRKVLNTLLLLFVSLTVALPFYLFSYQHTHMLTYSLAVHTDKLGEIGGEASLPKYIWNRTVLLPSSVTQLTLFSRDYTSLIFLVFLGIFILELSIVWKNKTLRFLFLFSIAQWLIWWYIPPLSTRYALSGFVVLLMLYFKTIEIFLQNNPQYKREITIAILFAFLFTFIPRSIPITRNVKYILGMQTKDQYLKQFYDGNIDQHIKDWYRLQ